MVVARWLVDRGAGRIVLNGRTVPPTSSAGALPNSNAAPSRLRGVGDIASPGVAEQLVTAAEETGLPLRGVVHGAAVLDDGLVVALSAESLERVWAPKAAGALRLHEVTATSRSRLVGGFSTVASLLGSPGQGPTRARTRGSTPW